MCRAAQCRSPRNLLRPLFADLCITALADKDGRHPRRHVARFRQREARLSRTRASERRCTPVSQSAVRCRRTRAGPGARQHLLEGPKHEVVDAARIAKSHLELLRMRVDIDLAGIQIQIQHVGAEPAVKQHILISQARRARQQLVAHETPVEEGELQVRLAAREGRQGQPSRKPQASVSCRSSITWAANSSPQIFATRSRRCAPLVAPAAASIRSCRCGSA